MGHHAARNAAAHHGYRRCLYGLFTALYVGESRPWHVAAFIVLRDGKVLRETPIFGAPLNAPTWRTHGSKRHDCRGQASQSRPRGLKAGLPLSPRGSRTRSPDWSREDAVAAFLLADLGVVTDQFYYLTLAGLGLSVAGIRAA